LRKRLSGLIARQKRELLDRAQASPDNALSAICQGCSTEYEYTVKRLTDAPRRRFCSQSCYYKTTQWVPKNIDTGEGQGECLECSASIPARQPNGLLRKFCSKKCKSSSHHRAKSFNGSCCAIPPDHTSRLMSERGGVIYVFQQGDVPAVKIGYTKHDVAARLVSMRTYSPYPVKVLAEIPGTMKLERRIHAELSEHRLEGEWFEKVDEVMAVVERWVSLMRGAA
jgi:endogenous inhibitor of DNA gyrase (YacG/DUF329 family)